MSLYPTKKDYRDAWANAEREDPPVPLNLDIELASACNLACPFCSWGESAFAQSMKSEKDFDGRPKKRFMPTQMAKALIDEAAKLGVPAIKFNFRGESTMHPDFSEIVAYAAAKADDDTGPWRIVAGRTPGKPLFHELLVNTNANCGEGAIKGLLVATKVMVSLDSMDPATYPKIRVGGDLEKAKATIRRLIGLGHRDMWVRRVICKTNQDEDFVGAVKAEFGSGVKVSEHYAFDRNADRRESVHAQDETAWERQYCGYPSQRVVVTASGKFLPCCIAWRDEFDLGTFGSMTIRDYWHSTGRKALVEQLRRNEFRNPLCENCTTFMSYVRPEREFVQDKEGYAK